jgi:membrane-bound lytic murein transglycosylase D
MRTTHLFLALFSAGALLAQDAVPADDPILENLDKLSILPWLKNDPFSTDVSALNVHHFAPGDMPTYSPEVYQQRLLELDEKSPFKLTYNDPVQSYINLYANNRREQTQRMLGLKELYFPIFEQALDRYKPAAGAEIPRRGGKCALSRVLARVLRPWVFGSS